VHWKPFTTDELTTMLINSDHWFLDGGHALDTFLRKTTRVHGDIDIGVLSTHSKELLDNFISKGFTVLIANRNLTPYVRDNDSSNDYNYWVTDGENYKVQVLVYTYENSRVLFRRNKEVSWPIENFTLLVDNIKIINPFVSYAFKVTNKSPLPKDLLDIDNLIKAINR
jgi:hypothetical protein